MAMGWRQGRWAGGLVRGWEVGEAGWEVCNPSSPSKGVSPKCSGYPNELHGHELVSIDIHKYAWISLHIQGFSYVSLDTHGFPLISIRIHGCLRGSLNIP